MAATEGAAGIRNVQNEPCQVSSSSSALALRVVGDKGPAQKQSNPRRRVTFVKISEPAVAPGAVRPPCAPSYGYSSSSIATAEVARALRFINAAFGVWLVAAPWVLDGHGATAGIASVALGIALIALSLPRGPRSRVHYAGWDEYII